MTLYFIVHSTIGSTPHPRPLNILEHCRPICTTMMTNIQSDRDSNLVGYLQFFRATAEQNDPRVMGSQIFFETLVKISKLGNFRFRERRTWELTIVWAIPGKSGGFLKPHHTCRPTFIWATLSLVLKWVRGDRCLSVVGGFKPTQR